MLLMPSPAPACLGRERELERLDAIFHQRAPGGRLVVIHGPPGVGKSTLAVEAEQRFAHAGCLVLSTCCYRGGHALQPMFEILDTIAHEATLLPDGEALHHSAHALIRTFQGGGFSSHSSAEVAPVALAPHGASPGAGGEEIGAPRSARATACSAAATPLDRLVELFGDLARRRPKLAIFFHDVDRADAATRQAVSYLVRELAPLPELCTRSFPGLIVCTAEQLAGEDACGGEPLLGELDGVNRISLSLSGLDAQGILAFLGAPAVIEELQRLTAGNPQQLKAILSGRPSTEDRAPLAQRTPDERQLLETLAVCASPVPLVELPALVGLSAAELSCASHALLKTAWLERYATKASLQLVLRSPHDQQAIYRGLGPSERRALHLRIASFLKGRESRSTEAVAVHLLAAEIGEEGVEMAMLAAEHLHSVQFPERACQLYHQALAQCADPQKRRGIKERLCQIHEELSQLDRAIALARELVSEGFQDASPTAMLRLIRLLVRQGDVQQARAAIDALLASPLPDTPLVQGQVCALLAEAELSAGDEAAAQMAAQRALAQLEGVPPSPAADTLRMQASHTLAALWTGQGKAAEAIALMQSILRSAQERNHLKEQAKAHVQLGLAHFVSGQLDRADHHYHCALERLSRLADYRTLAVCQQHLAVVAERRRHYDGAIKRYQEAVASFKKVGHRIFLAWVALDLAQVYLELGDTKRAQAMVALAERIHGQHPSHALAFHLELLHGRLAAAELRWTTARHRYRAAAERVASASPHQRHVKLIHAKAALALAQGDGAATERILASYPAQLTPFDQLQRLLLRATWAQQQGHEEQGLLAAALALSCDLQDPRAEAQVRLALAKGARAASEHRWQLELNKATAAMQRLLERIPERLQRSFKETPLYLELQDEWATGRPTAERPQPPLLSVVVAPPQMPPERPRALAKIVGQHPRVLQLARLIEKIGPTDATTLVRGESGTGKELVAEAIHAHSERATRKLIKVNCAALVNSLLLSELFGHERGAFTGATQRKLGRFELADGGTIFLDEIGDISAETQVALLRVLQERTFERVGGNQSLQVDVRIVCATHRNLEEMVRQGLFREDLYYRLRGVELQLPALRDRKSDIAYLAEHFLQEIAAEQQSAKKSLSPSALALLEQHRWPGNVRELENVLRSAALFCDHDQLRAADLGELSALATADAPPADYVGTVYKQIRRHGLSLRQFKKEMEERCIEEALKDAEGNITRAAELLGMKRPRLSQLVKEYGIVMR